MVVSCSRWVKKERLSFCLADPLLGGKDRHMGSQVVFLAQFQEACSNCLASCAGAK